MYFIVEPGIVVYTYLCSYRSKVLWFELRWRQYRLAWLVLVWRRLSNKQSRWKIKITKYIKTELGFAHYQIIGFFIFVFVNISRRLVSLRLYGARGNTKQSPPRGPFDINNGMDKSLYLQNTPLTGEVRGRLLWGFWRTLTGVMMAPCCMCDFSDKGIGGCVIRRFYWWLW